MTEMISQEQIAEIIFNKVIAVHEEFGPEIASAFLAGIKFAADLKENMQAFVESEALLETLGSFYSNISKGEIN